ncbi:MAG: hypothetical protein JW829_14825 [Pirellulales bacterium]|nr:hypothetical protein [Pirellulales bacterium]
MVLHKAGNPRRYLVIKRVKGQEVCVMRDGTTTPDRKQAELYQHDDAVWIAKLYGRELLSDLEAFPQD